MYSAGVIAVVTLVALWTWAPRMLIVLVVMGFLTHRKVEQRRARNLIRGDEGLYILLEDKRVEKKDLSGWGMILWPAAFLLFGVLWSLPPAEQPEPTPVTVSSGNIVMPPPNVKPDPQKSFEIKGPQAPVKK